MQGTWSSGMILQVQFPQFPQALARTSIYQKPKSKAEPRQMEMCCEVHVTLATRVSFCRSYSKLFNAEAILPLWVHGASHHVQCV